MLENNKNQAIKLFNNSKIRFEWDSGNEKWYLSIVDVIKILTASSNPRKYWSVLKNRLKKEGSQLATNCSQLKLLSSDGKYYTTDVADTEQILRLIQSVPSKKAEPFKLWLAKVGSERIDETVDPEITIDRAMKTCKVGDTSFMSGIEVTTGIERGQKFDPQSTTYSPPSECIPSESCYEVVENYSNGRNCEFIPFLG